MNTIDLHQIYYVREGTRILTDISWQVQQGQHWALMGANGSGKTTLLKVITGYEWPTEGEVSVLGERFGQIDLRELRRRIGWVSSSLEHQFPPHNRAIDVVVSGFDASIGMYREMSKAEWSQAQNALQHIGMAALAERTYRLLSQGEQQRTLIARALVNKPVLMVLDEPCSGLDPAAREHFLDDLSRLAGAPASPTMIVVTHHVEDIRPWITHALVIKAGRVLAAGKTADVLTSVVLSEAFAHPFEIENRGDRYYIRSRKD